jgi:hypothetical protein
MFFFDVLCSLLGQSGVQRLLGASIGNELAQNDPGDFDFL